MGNSPDELPEEVGQEGVEHAGPLSTSARESRPERAGGARAPAGGGSRTGSPAGGRSGRAVWRGGPPIRPGAGWLPRARRRTAAASAPDGGRIVSPSRIVVYGIPRGPPAGPPRSLAPTTVRNRRSQSSLFIGRFLEERRPPRYQGSEGTSILSPLSRRRRCNPSRMRTGFDSFSSASSEPISTNFSWISLPASWSQICCGLVVFPGFVVTIHS